MIKLTYICKVDRIVRTLREPIPISSMRSPVSDDGGAGWCLAAKVLERYMKLRNHCVPLDALPHMLAAMGASSWRGLEGQLVLN